MGVHYSYLESLFRDSTADTRFFIVFGVQGGGKTSWIRRHIESLGSSAIFLDAALPARRHRARALALARRFAVDCIAVCIKVPLERALEQNARPVLDEELPNSRFAAFSGYSKPQPMRKVFVNSLRSRMALETSKQINSTSISLLLR